MKLSDFKYNLPKTAIAKFPAEPRDKAKMMVLDRANNSIDHKKFSDIVDYMSKGDVLVVNEVGIVAIYPLPDQIGKPAYSEDIGTLVQLETVGQR